MVGLGYFSHGYREALARQPMTSSRSCTAIGMPFADLLGWATIIVEIVG